MNDVVDVLTNVARSLEMAVLIAGWLPAITATAGFLLGWHLRGSVARSQSADVYKELARIEWIATNARTTSDPRP